jgi:hypothetical protein
MARKKSICLPAISYSQASTSYFIHNGQVYPVASAPTSIFKAAMPTQEVTIPLDSVFTYDELDMPARFYIINRLSEKGKPLQMYKSWAEAEKMICCS